MIRGSGTQPSGLMEYEVETIDVVVGFAAEALALLRILDVVLAFRSRVTVAIAWSLRCRRVGAGAGSSVSRP